MAASRASSTSGNPFRAFDASGILAPAPTAVSLADEAYRSIRQSILRGQLRPGTPLSRRRLAQELGMSVLPVSDALHRLESDGLVETRARAGTRVRVPTADDIKNLYELREALETQAARLFAERATAAQRRALSALGRQVDSLFNRLPARGNEPGFRYTAHSRHVRLHMAIAQHARSPLLTRAIDRNHVLILNWLFDVGARRTPLPTDFHARLVEAVVSRDPDAAEAAMRAHVRFGLSEITANFIALAASEWRERRKDERQDLPSAAVAAET